jgi:hypothetical protein
VKTLGECPQCGTAREVASRDWDYRTKPRCPGCGTLLVRRPVAHDLSGVEFSDQAVERGLRTLLGQGGTGSPLFANPVEEAEARRWRESMD